MIKAPRSKYIGKRIETIKDLNYGTLDPWVLPKGSKGTIKRFVTNLLLVKLDIPLHHIETVFIKRTSVRISDE